MSYIGDKDFLIEVEKGNVAGHAIVHKFGRNPTVANGVWEHVSLLSGATSFLAAATTVRIKAGGHANDTAAGTKAREVTVLGIDSTLAEVSETIATAGAGASAATTASFWRVYSAWVSAAGTYGAKNQGAITIENSGGGTDLIQIGVEEGQTQYAGWTVPLGTTAYLLGGLLNVDALKAADVKLYTRANFNDVVAPMSASRIRRYWDGVIGTISIRPRSPLAVAALTDIWFEAEGSGAVTEVSIAFELLVVDD